MTNLETKQKLKRTDNCGKISEKDIGKEITVAGWVDTTRDLGGIIFIALPSIETRPNLEEIIFSPSLNAFSPGK